MIKVNLLREQQTRTSSSTKTSSGMSSTLTGLGISVPDGMGNKLMGFILPVIAVYGFNYYQLHQVENEIENMDREKTRISAEAKNLEPQLNQIAKYKTEKESLQKEIDELKGLSLGRYNTIKILDTIQTILPKQAWITALDYAGDTINLNGNATEDIAISSLIEELDRSLYFKDISWLDSRESKADNGELVKMFKISFKLENL